MLTSRHRLYALHVSPQRFSYSSAFAFSFACLSSSSLSSVSEVFVLLGWDTAAAATGLFKDVDATGGTDGAARRRYSSNQWLKHESYVRFRGVHGACSESMLQCVCLGRRTSCTTLSLVPAHSESRKVWHSSFQHSATMQASTSTQQAQAQEQEAAEIAALVSSLHARLVSSGEWARLSKQLRRNLDGSEWDKELKDYARGVLQCRSDIFYSEVPDAPRQGYGTARQYPSTRSDSSRKASG